MYKVLIVDDQALIRKGLVKMIKWDELKVELAGEAENGNAALELLKKDKADIVITDMRMPKCDGIGLLQNLSLNYPEIRTIVISGYNDFNYARQAVKSGSLDYILKPVEPADLNNAIKKACESIKESRMSGNVIDDERQASRYIYELIHGLEKAGDIAGKSMARITADCSVFCVTVIRLLEYNKGNMDLQSKLEKLGGFLKILAFDDSKECLAVFCDSFECSSYFENKVANALRADVFFSNLFKKAAVSGVGKACKKIGDIAESYNAACEAVQYRLLDENENLFIFNELSAREFQDIPVEQYESELIINITSGNFQNVESILHVIFDREIEKDKITLQSLKLTISKLCHILLKTDRTLSNEVQEFLARINSTDYLWKFKSFENIKQVLRSMFSLTTQKYIESQGGKDSLVMNVKRFINANFAEDLDLGTIGESLHVSVSYLCRIFKQETGEGINEYITKVRIENAKKLLRSGNVKIPQLAEMLGYSDPAYFYKVFKKITGMTPKGYQNNILHLNE